MQMTFSAFCRRSGSAAVTLRFSLLAGPSSHRRTPRRILGREARAQRVLNALRRLHEKRWIRPSEDGCWWMERSIRNRLYERFSDPLRSKRLRTALTEINRDDDSKQRLAFDKLIAAHCLLYESYAALARCSSDPWVIMEELYHRISAARYLTKMQLCLREGLLSESDLAGYQYLRRVRPQLFGRGRLDPGNIATVRREQVHAIATTLLRNASLLRAGIPAPSLLSWLDWFRNRDCKLLSLRHWDQSEGFVSEGRLSAEVAQVEANIERDVTELKRLLVRVENRAQADRMNFVATLDSAAEELGDLLACPPRNPDSPAGERRRAWVHWGETVAETSPITSDAAPKMAECLTLAQMSRAFGWAGAEGGATALVDVISKAATEQSGPDSYAYAALAHRCEADRLLINASPWDAKGQSLKRFIALQDAARDAAEAASKGVTLLETLQQDSASSVSYLLSLKGRALAILNRFGHAYSAFDESRAGLEDLPAHQRESRAISLLRLAECLLLRVDIALIPERDSFSRKDLSERGDKRFEQLGGEEHATPAKLLKVLAWQSAGNWRPEALDIAEAEAKERLELARTRLARTRDLLASAEKTLRRTRRRVEWWACLFQLQAQLEIESLLVMTVGGAPSREDRPMKISQLQQSLLTGLRAVRRGLDVLLPDLDERRLEALERDRRVNRMLRLWLELMLSGADLTLCFKSKTRLVSADELWRRWEELNHTAGLWRLPESAVSRGWIENWTRGRASWRESEWDTPLARRAYLIDRFDGCLNEGKCLEDLRNCLVRGAGYDP